MINNTFYPTFSTHDIFSKLKAKFQNEVRYYTHFSTLYNTLLEMFTWHNLPDTIPKRFLESFLHSTGEVFIAKINGELYACNGNLSGDVDAYGMGTDAIAVTPVGEAEGKRGVDIAYGVNNDTATPDTMIYWISHLLGENDKSLQSNILYSRYLPIPKVNDSKDKQAFDEIIDKLADGELRAFASRNVLADEFEGNCADVFSITDVNHSDKIQHLSRLYDDLIKRFYNIYGQPLQTQNKTAQTTTDELHGMDSVSFIIPLQMLRCRQALCEEINRIFDTNISVTFSDPWLYEYRAFIARDETIVDTLNEGDSDRNETEPSRTEEEPSGTETEPSGTETEPTGTETEFENTDASLEGSKEHEITDKAGIEIEGSGEDV